MMIFILFNHSIFPILFIKNYISTFPIPYNITYIYFYILQTIIIYIYFNYYTSNLLQSILIIIPISNSLYTPNYSFTLLYIYYYYIFYQFLYFQFINLNIFANPNMILLLFKILIIYFLYFQIHLQMIPQKNKKLDKSPYSGKVYQRGQYKFDITLKNYQCFIKKRPNINEKKKYSKNKSNPKTIIKSQVPNRICAQKKGEQEIKNRQNNKSPNPNNAPQILSVLSASKPKIQKKDLSSSPDLIKLTMNEVIHKIQNQGLESKWQEQENQQIDDEKDQDVFIGNSQRIWSHQSVISSTQKSFVSTEQTIFSGGNSSFNNNYLNKSNYFEYHHQILLRNQLSLNNSFNCGSQQRMYTQPYDIKGFDQRYQYAKKIFQIDFKNIQKDGRTTVMIKNIPNKYSLNLLSQQIDQKHQNLYDFLYLPFDYNNNCNVGYAFINFVRPEYIINFHSDFHKKKWLKFKSEKICILTYARLQGRKSLIEHFHNSKVLNQKQKRYRPIIRDLSKIEQLLQKQRNRK